MSSCAFTRVRGAIRHTVITIDHKTPGHIVKDRLNQYARCAIANLFMRHPRQFVIILLPAGLALCLFAAYVWRLHARINEMAGFSAAWVMPIQHALTHATGDQLIDLGYARFMAPQSALREPITHPAGREVISFNMFSTGKVDFLPPARTDADDLISDYNRQFEPRIGSLWDLQNFALSAEPFTIWDVPRIGRRETARRALLLAIKVLTIGKSKRVHVYQGAILDARLIQHDDLTLLEMRPGHGVWQVSVLFAGGIDVHCVSKQFSAPERSEEIRHVQYFDAVRCLA